MQTQPQSGYPSTPMARHLIGGRWYPPRGSSFARRNPANREDVVTVAPIATAEDITIACQEARQAQPAWEAMPVPERSALIARFASLLEAAQEPLARFLMREVGSDDAGGAARARRSLYRHKLLRRRGTPLVRTDNTQRTVSP